MFPISFDNYQAVKANLALWLVVPLYLASMISYFWILPEEHREFIRQLRWATWIQQVGLVAAMSVVSTFLVYGVQMHDQVYDKYLVHWREHYDVEILLPALCQPFQNKLDPRFYEVAKQHRELFMERLFYEYVHDRDPKIKQNTIVRFYERITNYWATQLAEIVTLALLVLSALYFPIHRYLHSSVRGVLLVAISAAVLLMLIDRTAQDQRQSVRDLTMEEIHEIHEKNLSDLESRVRTLSRELKLRYD